MMDLNITGCFASTIGVPKLVLSALVDGLGDAVGCALWCVLVGRSSDVPME